MKKKTEEETQRLLHDIVNKTLKNIFAQQTAA